VADISDNGAFNANLANIQSAQWGPDATTQRANTQANTALVGQQTAGAQIQNANNRLQFALFQRGLAHVTDFSGQGGPTVDMTQTGSSDRSGTLGAIPNVNAAPTGQVGGATGQSNSLSDNSGAVTPDDDIGQSAAKQGLVEAQLDAQYNVNPMGTPAEQKQIVAAEAWAAQMKLSGNQGLAASADQQVAMLKDQRDMNVKDRQNASQLEASMYYDKGAVVESAHADGRSFQILQATAPEAARRIQAANPDATPAELNDIAADTAGHVAAFIHRFTDRPTVVGDDGVTYDKESGMRVDVPIRGIPPGQQAALLDQANKSVTRTVNGQEATKPQYEWDGYQNPNLWVTHAVAQIQARNSASNMVEIAGDHITKFGHFVPGAPPVPGGTLYQGPTPGAPGAPGAGQPPGAPAPGAPGARQPPGAQPGMAPPQARPVAPPSAQPSAPGAVDPLRSPNAAATGGRLDFSDAPPSPLPNLQGSSAKPSADQVAIQTDYGKDVAASASTAAQKVSAANAAIQGANNAQIALKNGAMTGAVGDKAAYMQTILGNPAMLRGILGDPAARQVLEKALGNDAVMDIEKEAQSGGAQMRLGQNTMNMAINKLAASANMTPQAIMTMTNAIKANAQYDRQKWGSDFAAYNRTAGPGVDKRADAYSAWYDNKYPNSTTINPSTLSGQGNTPPVRTATGPNGQKLYLRNGQCAAQ
jgi:hypothetical protein